MVFDKQVILYTIFDTCAFFHSFLWETISIRQFLSSQGRPVVNLNWFLQLNIETKNNFGEAFLCKFSLKADLWSIHSFIFNTEDKSQRTIDCLLSSITVNFSLWPKSPCVLHWSNFGFYFQTKRKSDGVKVESPSSASPPSTNASSPAKTGHPTPKRRKMQTTFFQSPAAAAPTNNGKHVPEATVSEEKVFMFKKGKFLAVRNSEGTVLLLRFLQ